MSMQLCPRRRNDGDDGFRGVTAGGRALLPPGNSSVEKDHFWQAGERAVRWLMGAIAVAVVLARFGGNVVYPIAGAEDGTDMMGFYWQASTPMSVMRRFAGYTSLLPNAIGYLMVQMLPVRLVPMAYSLFAVLVAVWARLVFMHRGFREVVSSDVARAAICLGLAAVPLGHGFLNSNLTYSLWNMLLLVALLVWLPCPMKATRIAWRIALVGLLIASHPLSVMIVPQCAYLLYRRGSSRRDRLLLLVYAMMALMYQAFGVDHPNSVPHVLQARDFIRATIVRVFAEWFLGPVAIQKLWQGPLGIGAIVLTAIATIALLGTAGIGYRKRQIGHFVHLCLLWSIGVTLLAVLTRGLRFDQQMEVWWCQRYYFVQKAFVALGVASVLVTWLQDGKCLRFREFGRYIVAASIVTFLAWRLVCDSCLYRIDKSESCRLNAFLQQVDDYGLGNPVKHVFHYRRDGRFDIVLTVPKGGAKETE